MWKLVDERLSIQDIEVHAPLGVFDFEKESGNRFLVSIELDGDFSISRVTDRLDDTLDYSLVHDLVINELKRGGDLIESAADRIAQQLFQVKFPLQKIHIQIKKMNPPLNDKVGYTSFEVTYLKS